MLCLGAAHIDETIALSHAMLEHTSNPATISTGCGGVAFNVATGLAYLGHRVLLAAPLGDDADGQRILNACQSAGVISAYCPVRKSRPTGRYVAVLDAMGDLACGFADARLCDSLSHRDIEAAVAACATAADDDGLWFVDSNLPTALLAWLANRCPPHVRLVADTVSVAKAARISSLIGSLSILRTNRAEAEALVGRRGEPLVPLARLLADRVQASVVMTDGPRGTVVIKGPGDRAPAWLVPAPEAPIIDVTGAGDAATVGMMHGLAGGLPLADAVVLGHGAAALALGRSGADFTGFTPDHVADSAAEIMPYLDL